MKLPRHSSLDPRKLLRVEELLRDMVAVPKIRQICAGEFGVTEGQVMTWITLVYTKWQTIAQETAPHAREAIRAAFLEFYSKAMRVDATDKGPDYKAALQALDRLARIDGVYEPAKLAIETTGLAGLKSDGEVADRIKALLGSSVIQEKLAALGVDAKVLDKSDPAVDAGGDDPKRKAGPVG